MSVFVKSCQQYYLQIFCDKGFQRTRRGAPGDNVGVPFSALYAFRGRIINTKADRTPVCFLCYIFPAFAFAFFAVHNPYFIPIRASAAPTGRLSRSRNTTLDIAYVAVKGALETTDAMK